MLRLLQLRIAFRHCRVGSSEMYVVRCVVLAVRHCRVGSSEKQQQPDRYAGHHHCRVDIPESEVLNEIAVSWPLTAATCTRS